MKLVTNRGKSFSVKFYACIYIKDGILSGFSEISLKVASDITERAQNTFQNNWNKLLLETPVPNCVGMRSYVDSMTVSAQYSVRVLPCRRVLGTDMCHGT